jgi:hypothetical protein
VAGFSSLTGGGGLSASSSAKSGDAGTGAVGISIGGINTGFQTNSSGGIQPWMYLAAATLIAIFVLPKLLRGR